MSTIALLLSILLSPCATEDSSNCYWDAAQQGNGTGTSLIQLGNLTITLK